VEGSSGGAHSGSRQENIGAKKKGCLKTPKKINWAVFRPPTVFTGVSTPETLRKLFCCFFYFFLIPSFPTSLIPFTDSVLLMLCFFVTVILEHMPVGRTTARICSFFEEQILVDCRIFFTALIFMIFSVWRFRFSRYTIQFANCVPDKSFRTAGAIKQLEYASSQSL